VGTSGWSYEHWDEVFYLGTPASKRLSFYAEHFSAVEINSTFYHLTSEKTVKNWAQATPKEFIFAVKASRYITHTKRLKDPQITVRNFLKSITLLKRKLGPILFQLPPSFKLNYDRLKEFIEHLPKDHLYTFEFRHPSWYTDEIYQLLHEYNIALCITDLEGTLSPIEVTSQFVYIRLHGPKKAYRGSYSAQALKQWMKRIEDWNGQKKAVYLFFDNDEKGDAIQDAKRLKRLLEKNS